MSNQMKVLDLTTKSNLILMLSVHNMDNGIIPTRLILDRLLKHLLKFSDLMIEQPKMLWNVLRLQMDQPKVTGLS